MFNFTSNPITVQPTEKNPGRYDLRNKLFETLGASLGTIIGSSYKQKKESPILKEILAEYEQAVAEDKPTSGIIAKILGSGLSEDTQTKAISAISQSEKVRSEDRAIRARESSTQAQLGYYENKLQADIDAQRQRLEFENYKLEQTLKNSKYGADIKAYGEYFKSQLEQIDQMNIPSDEKSARKEQVINQWNSTLSQIRSEFSGGNVGENVPGAMPEELEGQQAPSTFEQIAEAAQPPETNLMRQNPILFDDVESYKNGEINSMQFLTKSYMNSKANPELFARALEEADPAILEDMSEYYLNGGKDYMENILDKEGAEILNEQYPGIGKAIEMAALNRIRPDQLHEKGISDTELRKYFVKYRNLTKYEQIAKGVKDALKEAL
jgi:hypothetical protein